MRFKIDATGAGQRLDKYLHARFGQMGLRGWRRAIEAGNALVNGKKTYPALRLQGAEELQILTKNEEESPRKAELVGNQGNYLFFYKPEGLHSVAVAGSFHDTLENQVNNLCRQAGLPEDIILLQRLDFGTAGLVCAARTPEAADNYRAAEQAGKCRKSYLALLGGILEEPVIAKHELKTKGGKKVRTKTDFAENPLQWTHFEPLLLRELPDYGWITIAKCKLCAGQRHQVRGHAAALGLPLLGDELYGSPWNHGFALAHYRIEFPGYSFQYLSPQSPFAALGCKLGVNGTLQCT